MKKEIQKTTKEIGNLISKNSPTILTAMGVAGLLTTTVMAVRATPKALRILEMEKDYRYEKNWSTEDIPKWDVVKLTWKCYMPAAVMASVTIACIVGANSINLRRNAALAGVYSITEAALKEYQAKVVETIGETKERKIKDEIAKDKIANNPVSQNEVVITGKGETLCYESMSGRYFKSDIEKLKRAENILNNALLKEDFISLNDAYYEFGLANTVMGEDVGWHVDDGMIAFDFSSQLSEDGTPCLVIGYEHRPSYDYMDRR